MKPSSRRADWFDGARDSRLAITGVADDERRNGGGGGALFLDEIRLARTLYVYDAYVCMYVCILIHTQALKRRCLVLETRWWRIDFVWVFCCKKRD